MKKTIFSLLLVVLMLSLISCVNSHSHEFGEWINVTNATCGSYGEMVRYCSCGEIQYQNISPTGIHTEVVDKGYDATCSSSGLTDGLHCSVCGITISYQTSIPTLPHTEVIDKGYDATCTSYGLSDGKHCSVCNTVIVSQQVITTYKHNFNTTTIDPTCTDDGYDSKNCVDCGYNENDNFVPAYGHSLGDTYITNNTFHWQECANCDYVSDKVEHTVDESGFCTVCGQPIGDTEGIIYDLSDDGSYAIVVGYNGTATKIKIAESYNGVPVKEIYSQAFYRKAEITSVVIPNSVIAIGNEAFFECHSLISVVIPDSVVTIGSSAFTNCVSLTSVVIPDSVTAIGYEAFYYCYNMTSVIIGDGVTTIDNQVFGECYNLSSVVIGDNVTTIGWGVFSGCSRLTFTEYDNCKYLGNGDNPYYVLIEVTNRNLSSYTIHDDTRIIAGNAFSNCDRLKVVEIPNNVIGISNSAFYECDSLTSVVIPDSVTTIGDSAFQYCRSLTSVVIGDSVTTIGDWVFYGCNSLTSVVIPDSVTTIGDWAFHDCNSLKDVFYTGSEGQWAEISISESNSYLTNATIHYNHVI